MMVRCCSDFRQEGVCVPLSQSHMSESVSEYFSDLGRAGPLECSWWGLLETRSFSQISLEGEVPVRFLRK